MQALQGDCRASGSLLRYTSGVERSGGVGDIKNAETFRSISFKLFCENAL